MKYLAISFLIAPILFLPVIQKIDIYSWWWDFFYRIWIVTIVLGPFFVFCYMSNTKKVIIRMPENLIISRVLSFLLLIVFCVFIFLWTQSETTNIYFDIGFGILGLVCMLAIAGYRESLEKPKSKELDGNLFAICVISSSMFVIPLWFRLISFLLMM